jgi:hypothetical protein
VHDLDEQELAFDIVTAESDAQTMQRLVQYDYITLVDLLGTHAVESDFSDEELPEVYQVETAGVGALTVDTTEVFLRYFPRTRSHTVRCADFVNKNSACSCNLLDARAT